MNLASLKTVAKVAGHKNLLLLKKHSPTILMATGLVGMVTTTVLASKATLNLEPIMDDMDNQLAKVNRVQAVIDEDGELAAELEYTDKELQRVKVVIYAKSALSIAKLYAPAAAVGAVSIAAIVGGHVQLTKRNAAMVAAYTALQTGFTKYRQRVVEEFGEVKDQEFTRPNGVLVEHKDEVTGEISTQFHVNQSELSFQSNFFDASNENWSDNPQYNAMFLRSQQNYANDRLRKWGHLLLNDVHDMLGLERTHAGQVMGWTWKTGDEIVDFGIEDILDRKDHIIWDGDRGRSGILLQFNVPGPVHL
jgi:hypothetical protein